MPHYGALDAICPETQFRLSHHSATGQEKLALPLVAIEGAGSVRQAVKDFHENFSRHSEKIGGTNSTTYWHNGLGISGSFKQWQRQDGSDRFYNGFGFTRRSVRTNLVVEINPPSRLRYRNMQGVLAHSEDGARWLLHKGRMQIVGRKISEREFGSVTRLSTCTVAYSDDETVECYPVANIDSESATIQEQVASFVRECNWIRLYYQFGEEVANRERKVLEAENSSPELTGTYQVGPRRAQEIERRHGKVWHALTQALDVLGRKHTNQRVGRWGPDLVTCDKKTPALFEIKIGITSTDLQTAIGQLFLYEQLLNTSYCKVLVIPKELSQPLSVALRNLNVEVLTFDYQGNSVCIDQAELRRLTR